MLCKRQACSETAAMSSHVATVHCCTSAQVSGSALLTLSESVGCNRWLLQESLNQFARPGQSLARVPDYFYLFLELNALCMAVSLLSRAPFQVNRIPGHV